jgi:hypothetical protein
LDRPPAVAVAVLRRRPMVSPFDFAVLAASLIEVNPA